MLTLNTGQPPRWTPRDGGVRLAEDRGVFFRDPNAAHFPTYPMEPAVRSVLETNPAFPCQDIDVFGCGATLGNILRFACAVDSDKPFRLRVDMVDETAVITRRENSPREVIPDIRGFGHTFPEAFTTWEPEAENSRTHQRIVRYEISGVKVLIRFEGDASYVDDDSEQVVDTRIKAGEAENLAKPLANSSSNKQARAIPQKSAALTLNIIRGRRSVPQSMILDIKTRSDKRTPAITVSKEMPRLWIRQIPFFALAHHTNGGLFQPNGMKVMNVKEGFREWERINQEGIRNFVSLIKKIVETAKATPLKRLEVCYSANGKYELELRKQVPDLPAVLPEDLVARWSAPAVMPNAAISKPAASKSASAKVTQPVSLARSDAYRKTAGPTTISYPAASLSKNPPPISQRSSTSRANTSTLAANFQGAKDPSNHRLAAHLPVADGPESSPTAANRLAVGSASGATRSATISDRITKNSAPAPTTPWLATSLGQDGPIWKRQQASTLSNPEAKVARTGTPLPVPKVLLESKLPPRVVSLVSGPPVVSPTVTAPTVPAPTVPAPTVSAPTVDTPVPVMPVPSSKPLFIKYFSQK